MKKIGVIYVDKEITDASVRPVIEKLDSILNSRIPGVVLRLNSPGGTVGASQEVYSKVLELKAKGKIVVASMGDIACSGAYYMACAADKIVANPGTLTGSIGVIMNTLNLQDLFNKIGYKSTAIKSCQFKDIGNPNREMTEEEKIILQNCIDDTYSQFVQAVAEGRKLPVDVVTKLADGRIYTGKQAADCKLVDILGTLDDAVHVCADLIGITKFKKVDLRNRLLDLKNIISISFKSKLNSLSQFFMY